MRSAHHNLIVVLAAAVLAAAVPATGQVALFSLQAQAGDLSTSGMQFGFHDDALDGPDPFDLPEPPAPPADYLSLAFAMPDPGGVFPNRWRRDIRAAGSFVDQLELWELHVCTDQLGVDCQLDFAHLVGAELPLRLRVLGLGGEPLEVTLPGQVTFQLISEETVLWLELSSDVPIAAETCSFGLLKIRYR
jgi:hypothetical protein